MKKAGAAAAALLFFAASAGMAETLHPRDYPNSPTFVSPAQLYRFSRPELALDAGYSSHSERQNWSGGDVTEAQTEADANVQLVRQASPSVYWGATFSRRTEFDTSGDTATLGATQQTAVRTATVIGPDAAYKIMDTLVLGIGARLRRIDEQEEGAAAWSLNHAVLSQGVLLKTEWYEAGWAQTLYLINQDTGDTTTHRTFRETILHARYHANPDAAYGVIVRRNPMPPCCLAEATDQITYTLTGAWQLGDLTLETLATYAPAFVSGPSYDIARTMLTVQASYEMSPLWALTARAAYGFGHTQAANVRLPTPLGLTDTADVLALDRGVALGAVRAL